MPYSAFSALGEVLKEKKCRYLQLCPVAAGLTNGSDLPPLFGRVPSQGKFVRKPVSGRAFLRFGYCDVRYAMHYDEEDNVLMQLQGTKAVTLMPPEYHST